MIFTSAARNTDAEASSAAFVSAMVGADGSGAETGATAGVRAGVDFDATDGTFFGVAIAAVFVASVRLGSVMGGSSKPGSTGSVEDAVVARDADGCGIGVSFAMTTMSAKKARAATMPR